MLIYRKKEGECQGMGQVKEYSREYKEEAIKLAEEKGCKKASEELGISYHTLYDWIKQARKGIVNA